MAVTAHRRAMEKNFRLLALERATAGARSPNKHVRISNAARESTLSPAPQPKLCTPERSLNAPAMSYPTEVFLREEGFQCETW